MDSKVLRILFVLICFNLAGFKVNAQQIDITGKITGMINNPLPYASIALLKPTDSTLINFAISENDGSFKLINNDSGNYILQVYLLGFEAHFQDLKIENKSFELPLIKLKENIQSLDEITISAIIPVQIKRDTVAYNANSFKIHHDDNIEDLLEKLPGVELNPDGSIQAQGNEITKILVDGKEFFSGDPAIVLKNLSAQEIKQVQVIDKKSDEAELTGVQDNDKNYVINLTLKKKKKGRGFGKAAAGLGSEGKYFTDINYNRFTSKTQFSIIGKFNNINITGSNIQDFLSYSGGLTDDTDDENTPNTIPRGGLSGVLTTKVGGFNTGFEFRKKEVLNVDYFYSSLENSGITISKRINFSSNRNFVSNSTTDITSTNNSHRANFNYENKSNKVQRLFIRGNFSASTRDAFSERESKFIDEDDELKYTLNQDFENHNDRNSGRLFLNYIRNLNKNKRNFSTKFIYNGTAIQNENIQTSINTKPNSTFEKIVESYRDNNFKNSTTQIEFNFNEPLGGNHFLKFKSNSQFGRSAEDAEQIKKTNDQEPIPLFYEIGLDENRLLSAGYYNYNTQKLNIIAGVDFLNLHRTYGYQESMDYGTTKNYTSPNISIKFKPNKKNTHYLNFRQNVRSPRLFESSPVINDINPWSTLKGNPNLEPEVQKIANFNSTINNFSKSISFYGRINIQHTSNAIIRTIETDENYQRTRSFDNFGNRRNYRLNLNFSKRNKALGLRYTLGLNGNRTYGKSLVQNELNDVTGRMYKTKLTLENNNKTLFDLKIGGEFIQNNSDFSIAQNINRNFSEQHYFMKFDYDITKKINFNTNFDYHIYRDSNYNEIIETPFLNASLSYAVTKNDNGIIKFLMIDLFDQSIDIQRRSTLDYFEETTKFGLGRYFILSFSYRLQK